MAAILFYFIVKNLPLSSNYIKPVFLFTACQDLTGLQLLLDQQSVVGPQWTQAGEDWLPSLWRETQVDVGWCDTHWVQTRGPRLLHHWTHQWSLTATDSHSQRV